MADIEKMDNIRSGKNDDGDIRKMSEWYDWCKSNHVCYRCGKVRADEGYTTCLACRMALRERKKELRRDHINPSEIGDFYLRSLRM